MPWSVCVCPSSHYLLRKHSLWLVWFSGPCLGNLWHQLILLSSFLAIWCGKSLGICGALLAKQKFWKHGQRKFLLSNARINRESCTFLRTVKPSFCWVNSSVSEKKKKRKKILAQKGLLYTLKICLKFSGICRPKLSTVGFSQSSGKALQTPTEYLGIWLTAEPRSTAFLVMDGVLKYED